MKIEIELDEEELKNHIYSRIADAVMSQYFECTDIDNDPDLDWRERDRLKAKEKKRRMEWIAKKIDWAKAPEYLQETVIKKFFDKVINWK